MEVKPGGSVHATPMEISMPKYPFTGKTLFFGMQYLFWV